MKPFRFIVFIAAVVIGWLPRTLVAGAAPIELTFRPPPGGQNPFAREIWAQVTTPTGKILRLPAFFVGDGRFAVRARAAEKGRYRLGEVTETTGRDPAVIAVAIEQGERETSEPELLPQVTKTGGRPARLLLADGHAYIPVGANLAWGDATRVQYHLKALEKFGGLGLNWMRVWMAHWTALNLDWLPPDLGPSPAPGSLDLRVAADWDRIVAQAETSGVYLQIVLQHHGQYSTSNNSNWAENPWNAARSGGFLKTPAEFFSSPEARRLTECKYRYIVARWGYSPAVLSWEIFNEVHWTDAFRMEHDEAAVARWHLAMARYLRSVDSYHHLVTTSTENLHSPIYDELDYFQPHNYPPDVLAGARTFQAPPGDLNRPVFYGEMGDDHAPFSQAQKDSAIGVVPQVWASVMGQGSSPGQPWLGWDLLRTGRLSELGAVARFESATGLGARDGLVPFSPALECSGRQPLVVVPGEAWQREAPPEMSLPLDGREPLERALLPATYVGSAESLAEGFPGKVTLRLNAPAQLSVHVRVSGIDRKASEATISVLVDGTEVARRSWKPNVPDTPSPEHPGTVLFSVAPGAHTLVVQNPGAPGWFELGGIDFGLEVPAIAAIGRRGPEFIAVWLWHRTGLFSLVAPPAVAGTVLLDDVSAGDWHVTWWDSVKGVPISSTVLHHPGGQLRLPAPPVDRQAAVVLTR